MDYVDVQLPSSVTDAADALPPQICITPQLRGSFVVLVGASCCGKTVTANWLSHELGLTCPPFDDVLPMFDEVPEHPEPNTLVRFEGSCRTAVPATERFDRPLNGRGRRLADVPTPLSSGRGGMEKSGSEVPCRMSTLRISQFLQECREKHVTVIHESQYLRDIPANVRAQASLVLLRPWDEQSSTSDVSRAYREFSHDCPSLVRFRAYVAAVRKISYAFLAFDLVHRRFGYCVAPHSAVVLGRTARGVPATNPTATAAAAVTTVVDVIEPAPMFPAGPAAPLASVDVMSVAEEATVEAAAAATDMEIDPTPPSVTAEPIVVTSVAAGSGSAVVTPLDPPSESVPERASWFWRMFGY